MKHYWVTIGCLLLLGGCISAHSDAAKVGRLFSCASGAKEDGESGKECRSRLYKTAADKEDRRDRARKASGVISWDEALGNALTQPYYQDPVTGTWSAAPPRSIQQRYNQAPTPHTYNAAPSGTTGGSSASEDFFHEDDDQYVEDYSYGCYYYWGFLASFQPSSASSSTYSVWRISPVYSVPEGIVPEQSWTEQLRQKGARRGKAQLDYSQPGEWYNEDAFVAPFCNDDAELAYDDAIDARKREIDLHPATQNRRVQPLDGAIH